VKKPGLSDQFSLLEDLKDKETRDIYVEEHIITGLPFQIHGLREKHGLAQSELAKRAGMAQERISKLEDPNYEFIPKIPTLLKLASVFDVPLIVKFGSWSEFFDREIRLSPELLAPRTFDEEIESIEEEAASVTTYAPTIITNYRERLEFGQQVEREAIDSERDNIDAYLQKRINLLNSRGQVGDTFRVDELLARQRDIRAGIHAQSEPARSSTNGS
jgi:transcriptional regulator with XRE-family HTH domain